MFQNLLGHTKADLLITKERDRQKLKEGYNAAHDFEHDNEELFYAGLAYEMNEPGLWPFEKELFKPKTQKKNFIRAGALYQAEAERCMRLPQTSEIKTKLYNAKAARLAITWKLMVLIIKEKESNQDI